MSPEVLLQGLHPKSCSKGCPRSLAQNIFQVVLFQGFPQHSGSEGFPRSLAPRVSPDVLEHPPKLRHVVDGTVFILTRVCFSKMFGTLSVSEHAVCVYWHECLFCRTYMLSFTNESFPNITSCISASQTNDSERDIC